MRKSLHNLSDVNEIINRIHLLHENSPRKWGSMNVSQMMVHCAKILEIPNKNLQLRNPHFLIKVIGVVTKYELRIFNNGIPLNMPTFKEVIVNETCDFLESKKYLLTTLDEYVWNASQNNLPKTHQLFGKMTKFDWGFLEYKHLHHHLKQFNV